MTHHPSGASYKNQPAWLDRAFKKERADGGPIADEVTFPIESRDYSKQPASFGEKALATAKIVAEPYASIARKAYHRIRGE